MATNTILTPTMVTREILRILHQKLSFITNINTQYDSSYAKEGAKIGDTLKIRLPNQYVVTSGAALSSPVQDTAEQSVSLTVSSQKHVDVSFTSAELTLSLDDFRKRILDPAISVLAANIEADAFNMLLDVYNGVNNIGAAATMRTILQGEKQLTDNLTPQDDNRYCILNTQDNLDLVDALKGLFQSSTEIEKQYKTGRMGMAAGMDFLRSTLVPTQTTGTCAATTGYAVNGNHTTNGTTAVTVKTGANTFKKGDIFTVAGCYRVHPETKADTGELQQFVVTADYSGGAGDLNFSPAIYTSGGRQNVVAAGMAGNSAIVKFGGASAVYRPSIAFHRDAFAFATADLIMPKGVDFAARDNFEGLSVRIVRQYDINTDALPCRIDILYGYKTIRPQLASRILSN
jgi:hypothetical protein